MLNPGVYGKMNQDISRTPTPTQTPEVKNTDPSFPSYSVNSVAQGETTDIRIGYRASKVIIEQE